jgi:sarcosine/dimethylglycine N-methyltransferase
MARGEEENKIREQYSEKSGAVFYRFVMGDQGPAIHYGHYQTSGTPMKEAVAASTQALLQMAARHDGQRVGLKIIDLGAGAGGAAHLVSQATGGQVHCLDLCPHLNRDNLKTAEELGIAAQITTSEGSFETLPGDWNERFDWVWSQDAFCHASDRRTLFSEVTRVLKPGGLLIFSDIFRDENASDEDLLAFSGVNAVPAMGTISGTVHLLKNTNFQILERFDWSRHLRANFAAMLAQIERHGDEMMTRGVQPEMVASFRGALQKRLAWSGSFVMRWAAFVCRKGG